MKARKNSIVSQFLAAGAALGLVFVPPAQACTGIELIAVDGTVVHARTLEFGIDLKSNAITVPRGYSRTATTPTANPARLGLQNSRASAPMPWACRS